MRFMHSDTHQLAPAGFIGLIPDREALRSAQSLRYYCLIRFIASTNSLAPGSSPGATQN